MNRPKRSPEQHYSNRAGWLRATVLGANDGLISTGSLVVGVASAQVSQADVFLAASAGVLAGALSMAAGEYVSVSSQADSEEADVAKERRELEEEPERERAELTAIYVSRGLPKALAEQVADAMMAKDALAAHTRDELGILEHTRARPLQAALASAGAFTAGAALPLLMSFFVPVPQIPLAVGVSTLAVLAGLGATAARLGGAPVRIGMTRVMFWGVVALVATWALGRLFGTRIS